MRGEQYEAAAARRKGEGGRGERAGLGISEEFVISQLVSCRIAGASEGNAS